MKDKTVLEKIGISDEIVKKWKKRGLKITYPIKQNPNWFKSADGKVFWEQADKFVPLLTKRETKLYIKYPEKFREDFLKNLKFFREFCDFIFITHKKIKKLKGREKVAVSLSLQYLFQRAIDFHYYHWDRYIVYEEYPQTPVGYWWKKLRVLYTKATKKKVSKQNPPEDFLKLLTLDQRILKEFKNNLSKKDFLQLKKSLQAIKIFEETNQMEIEMLMDYRRKTDVVKRTGFSMLNEFWKEIEKDPAFIRKEGKSKIKRIRKIHPIIGARRLLLTPALKCFDKEIFSQFQREIKRWL